MPFRCVLSSLLIGGCALLDGSLNELSFDASRKTLAGMPPGGQVTPASESTSTETDPAGEAESSFAPLSRGELWARWNAFRGDEYELDSVERWMPEGERATCDRSALVSYPGTTIRY
ncbi:MAG TPA: hypothetical protein VGK73_15460, partial [Polyangiaceae bacterium]